MNPKNKGIVGATLAGIKGRSEETAVSQNTDYRIHGSRCLVTGGTGGLGKAVATQLASMGGRVVMAGRTLDSRVQEEVISKSGNESVEMEHLDMASFESVLDFVARTKEDARPFSIVVINAAVVTKKGFVTTDELDEMTQVNFLSNVLLLERLIASQSIQSNRPDVEPRIVVVSSEAHRWSEQIDLDSLGAPRSYTMKKAMAEYSDTKFLMAAYTARLARQHPGLSVLALCPGAINSNLARQAPAVLKPLLRVIFKLFFASPQKAARPVIHLTCAPSMEGRTGVYFHLMNEKQFDERAADEAFGERVYERALAVIEAQLKRSSS